MSIYRKAMFRDAAFFVDTAEYDGGRKNAVHEFPSSDEPETQDMGRKARRFSIEGYLLGANHVADSEKLITACEQGGPGALIHPLFGTRIVKCDSFRVLHKLRTRRITYVTMSFIQEPASVYELQEDIDVYHKIMSLRDRILQILEFQFMSVYSLSSLPNMYADSASRTISQLCFFSQKALSEQASSPHFVKLVNKAISEASSLVFSPEGTIQFILSLVFFLFSDDAAEGDKKNIPASDFSELIRLYDFDNDLIDEDDPSSVIILYTQVSSVIASATVFTQVDFNNVEEAYTFRDLIIAKMDSIAGRVPDDIFRLFMELKVFIMEDIERRVLKLSKIVKIVLPESTPALVMSNTVYGDILMEKDIVKRNRVLHPGFVPGGQDIEVLVG